MPLAVLPPPRPHLLGLPLSRFTDQNPMLHTYGFGLAQSQFVLASSRENNLTDAGLEYLRRLPRLHDLVLRRTQVTDAAVRTLRQIPELQHVDIEETRITDEGRRALGSLVAEQFRRAKGN